LRAESASLHVPVVDLEDEEVWNRWRGTWDTPWFYGAILDRWPGRFTAAVVAVTRARPGGVLVHRQAGRDRTGLVTALLLSVVGVTPAEIAADYVLSAERLRPLYARLEREARDGASRDQLRRENASEATWVLELLGGLDVETYLLEHGATPKDLAELRARLVDPRGARSATAP
jgi:protein-tyrosine phosphatase